jgi:hypothetical protein
MSSRCAPYICLTFLGISLDWMENKRTCYMKHPVPDWYIENAIPHIELPMRSRAPIIKEAIIEMEAEEDQNVKHFLHQRAAEHAIITRRRFTDELIKADRTGGTARGK